MDVTTPCSPGMPPQSHRALSEVFARSKVQLATVLGALYFSLFLTSLDTTIITTALPTIVSDLGSSNGYIWIGAAYILSSTAVGPIWSNLSDIWGRKPLLLASLAFFTASSVVCARATTIQLLIAGRVLQGIGAGGVILLVSIIISDLFDLRTRSLYLGMCEIVWAASGAVGPVLGGALSEYASWRWIWYLNIPAGVVGMIVLIVLLDVHNPRTPLLEGLIAVDWAGSFTILIITVLTLVGLNLGGQEFAWSSPQVLCLLIVGICTIVGFVVVEDKWAKYPLMPMRLFRQRSNIAVLGLSFAHGMVMMGGEYYLPLFYQSVRLASPFKAGVLALPFVFLEALAGIVSGIVIHRSGKYLSLQWIGVVLMVVGFGLFITFSPISTLGQIVVIQCVAACGSGLLLEPPLIALQASPFILQRDVAAATSTFNLMRSISQSVSVIVGGGIFANSMTEQMKLKRLPQDIAEKYDGEHAAGNVLDIRAMTDAKMQYLVVDAFSQSLRRMWIFYLAVAVTCVGLVTLIQANPLSANHAETRTGLTVTQEQQSVNSEADNVVELRDQHSRAIV